MHTKQSVFDTVAKALIAQGQPAMNGPQCRYRVRGTDLKCGVGHLIPDAEYKECMEGNNVVTLSRDAILGPTLNQIATHVGVSFLRELQEAHDDASPDPINFVPNLIRGLTQTAKDHDLNTKALTCAAP